MPQEDPLSGTPFMPMTGRSDWPYLRSQTRRRREMTCCDSYANEDGYTIAGASDRRTMKAKDTGFAAAAAVCEADDR